MHTVMDELPESANRNLPRHTKFGLNERCMGGEVTNTFSDVGCFVGECPICGKSFVYISGNNSWMEEEVFDRTLQENNPLAGMGVV